MFLNLDKIRFKNNLSIANKFTIMYTTASLVVVILIAVGLSWVLSDLMTTAERQFLIDEVYVIKGLLEKNNQQLSSIKQEVDGVPATLKKDSSYYYYIHIKDQKNKIVMSTPGAETRINNAPFPPVNKMGWQNNIVKWQANNGQSYLLMNAPINTNHGNVTFSMEMALNIGYPQSLITKYQHYIFIFLLLLFALLILLGKLIAKSSLKSLYEMAKITQQITVSKLSNRINPKEWPKELLPLGHSFNDMLAGIERAFDNLSQCTNELAHELRMPVNNLIGSTEIILSRPRDLNEYYQLLTSNLEEFKRLSKLTDNILFLARNEFPNNAINKKTLRLEKEVSLVCEFYKYLAAEKNINIQQQGQAVLQGDQLLIQRVITNLLSNAIKYGKNNGNITITIKQSPANVELEIADDGIGISQEHLTNIFNRFYRVSATTKATNSWGLGLPIVKSILELHKGSITVTSEPEKGSKFCLRFPCW